MTNPPLTALNGRYPAERVIEATRVPFGLRDDIAPHWEQMVEFAALDGIKLACSQGYRSLQQQIELLERRCTDQNSVKGAPSIGVWDGRRWWLLPGMAPVAIPGTSEHGEGDTIDALTDGPTIPWLDANGAAHGWHPTVPGEPWHWRYWGDDTAPTISTPTTNASEEDDMAKLSFVATEGDPAIYAIGAGAPFHVESPADAQSYVDAGIVTGVEPGQQWDARDANGKFLHIATVTPTALHALVAR